MAHVDAFPVFRHESREGQKMEGSLWNNVRIEAKYGCLLLQYFFAPKPIFLEPISKAKTDWRNSRVLRFEVSDANSRPLKVLLQFRIPEDFQSMRTAVSDVKPKAGIAWELKDLVYAIEQIDSGRNGTIYRARMSANARELICIKAIARHKITLESVLKRCGLWRS